MSQFTVKIFNPAKYSCSLKRFLRDWLGVESNETNNIILKQILGTLERIEKIKNEEEVDGVDLGFINPEDIVDRAERVQNYQIRQSSLAAVYARANGSRKRLGQSCVSNNYYGREDTIYQSKPRNELINPAWVEVPYLSECELDFLDPQETEFFRDCIDRYVRMTSGWP